MPDIRITVSRTSTDIQTLRRYAALFRPREGGAIPNHWPNRPRIFLSIPSGVPEFCGSPLRSPCVYGYGYLPDGLCGYALLLSPGCQNLFRPRSGLRRIGLPWARFLLSSMCLYTHLKRRFSAEVIQNAER